VLKAAYQHKGLSFVRIMQRCPTYTPDVFTDLQKDPAMLVLLTGGDNLELDAATARSFPNKRAHDTRDLDAARQVAAQYTPLPVGVLYRNPGCPCYEDFTTVGLGMSVAEKMKGLNRELDKFAV
jgi:2-oxoglutarate ferredoxin oxidoreductase subunit beta